MFRPHQIPLCCPCGNLQLFCRGFCRACYGRRHRSRTHFSGLRGKILARDHHRCRVCGAREQLVVHHRRPRNVSNALITLCAACHARLHRLAAMDRWIPEFLAELWAEQHPGVARQIQFPEAARRRPTLPGLGARLYSATRPGPRQPPQASIPAAPTDELSRSVCLV